MIRNLTRSLRRGNRNDRQSRQMDLNAVVGSGATAFGVRRQPEPLAPEPRERRERERDSRRVRQDAIREAKLRRMRGRSGESSEQEGGDPSQEERENLVGIDPVLRDILMTRYDGYGRQGLGRFGMGRFGRGRGE